MDAGSVKERARVVVAGCFYYGGLVRLAHWRARRSGHRLIILNYHRATGGDLRRQLLYLRRQYRLLHLEEALEELYAASGEHVENRDEKRGNRTRRRDRRIPLVLTFDDGYRDNYTLAYALARELAIPITIFLIPSYIDSGDHFWWLEGERLARRAQVHVATIEGHTYVLAHEQERVALARAIDARARHASTVAEREAFLAAVREILAVPTSVAAEDEPAMPLSWTEVREMAASGWVSFGAHTQHHPVLAYLADLGELQHEVGECRSVLEQRLGQRVATFAYPVGKPEHIGDEAPRAAREAGYRWALTTIEAVNTPATDPYFLRRLPGDVTLHWLVMASELAGLLGNLSRIRKTLRGKLAPRQRPQLPFSPGQSVSATQEPEPIVRAGENGTGTPMVGATEGRGSGGGDGNRSGHFANVSERPSGAGIPRLG